MYSSLFPPETCICQSVDQDSIQSLMDLTSDHSFYIVRVQSFLSTLLNKQSSVYTQSLKLQYNYFCKLSENSMIPPIVLKKIVFSWRGWRVLTVLSTFLFLILNIYSHNETLFGEKLDKISKHQVVLPFFSSNVYTFSAVLFLAL